MGFFIECQFRSMKNSDSSQDLTRCYFYKEVIANLVQ